MLSLRPQWRVSEAHLNQAHKPCSIRVIPPQTYGNVSNGGGLLTPSDDKCSNDTRFTTLVEMSLRDPHGGLKLHSGTDKMKFKEPLAIE